MSNDLSANATSAPRPRGFGLHARCWKKVRSSIIHRAFSIRFAQLSIQLASQTCKPQVPRRETSSDIRSLNIQNHRYLIRRSAVRALFSPSAFLISRPRTIVTAASRVSLRPAQLWAIAAPHRRFLTDDAAALNSQSAHEQAEESTSETSSTGTASTCKQLIPHVTPDSPC